MRKYLQILLLILVCGVSLPAQTKIPAPVDVLGFTPGDDKKLASWNQVLKYFEQLDKASDRIQFQSIGKTTMEVPFVYATISSPENLKNLEKYKQINQKLADPRLIKSNQKLADDLIKQGKTIVLITCGVHSNEVGSYLSSMLIAHRLASSNDAEVKKILDQTIVLLVPSLNPDGVDIIKNWYDKTVGTPYEGSQPPELYHKYVGHDDNRDWYAFTQVETQMTVDKIHNVWHPQIVHDIHQQGANGARLFIPPYLNPVEPNVPKELIEGYTELGNYMAKDLRSKGLQGITTDSTYDAWTPARAYSHYHGGVRILSETASVRTASPVNIKFDQLRNGLAVDVKKESANFGPVWQGGDWTIRDITNYMTSAAFSLMNHAADNREAWLKRFYAIGKEAVRPRRGGELKAFRITGAEDALLDILKRGGVEYYRGESKEFVEVGSKSDKSFYVIPMNQPYGNFAKALLEKQEYPNLRDEKGNPIQPYDVTAHTLSLLMETKVEPLSQSLPPKSSGKLYKALGHPMTVQPKAGIYKSSIASMDEGWTRWLFDKSKYTWIGYVSVSDSDIRNKLSFNQSRSNRAVSDNNLLVNTIGTKTIIFPDQSARQILNGYPKGAMPDEYTGGVGKEGVENLKKFVEAGGTLVFLNSASDFAIEQFNLPVRDVTKGLARKDFFIPGSILRTEIDTNHPLAKGMPKESIAWFEDSPAFEVAADAKVEIIAKYPANPENILLSGWALGKERLSGKAALVSVPMGKGKIVLFGFRPQYRGQSLATFPLLFNAIAD